MRAGIPKQQIDLLGQVPLFTACSQAELRSIARLGTRISAEPGAILTAQGKPGSEFFLVLEGTATCKVGRREVRKFKSGNYFGELALLHGGYRSATVEAVTPMELLVLDAREFRSMVLENPTVALKVLSRLAERLTEADAQYSD
jgi:CRP/FNR family transcriptional regulator, cyclic AMP receptor protein